EEALVRPVRSLIRTRLEVLEEPPLLVGQLSRDCHVDEDALVAAPESLQDGHPAPAEDPDLAGLRSRRELDLELPLQRRHRAPPRACGPRPGARGGAWFLGGSAVVKTSFPSGTKRGSGRPGTST